MNEKNGNKTKFIVYLAVLTAILLLLEVTGLGYIKTGVLEFTIMQVPVIIGAIIMGPTAGAILGGIFGLTSFWECFGRSIFGGVLLSINPLYTFIVCFFPRLLMGWLCGVIFKAFGNKRTQGIVPYGVASLSGALLNTILFMGTLILLFGRTEYILSMRGEASVLMFIVGMVGVQGVLEALICCIIGAIVSKSCYNIYNKKAS